MATPPIPEIAQKHNIPDSLLFHWKSPASFETGLFTAKLEDYIKYYLRT